MPIETDEKKTSSLEEYLHGPQKKRKDYILLAFGKDFNKNTAASIQNFIRTKIKQASLLNPTDINELKRLFTRQILLVIVHDQFSPLDQTMLQLRNLKEKSAGKVFRYYF